MVVSHGRGPFRVGWIRTAGVLYTLTWCAGLSVFSSDTSVRTTGAAILAADRGHQVAVTAQFLLTQGFAGLMLAVVVGSIYRAVGPAGNACRKWIFIAGGCAALVSLIQCALGVWLAADLVPAGDVAAVGSVTRLLSHLDGVKMTALAVLVGTISVAARRHLLVLPNWLRLTGWVTVATLIVSAAGYIVLDDVLASAAWLSLPLLLVSITGTALVLHRPATDVRSETDPMIEPDAVRVVGADLSASRNR